MASSTTPTQIDFTKIDFNDLKGDLIKYITSVSDFTDQNFEGSNLNLLVSLLAYVTNILAYNLNQGINECNLSTAQLRANVLRLIKYLNYLPERAHSSKIILDLSEIVTTTEYGAANLLKYDKVTSNGLSFYYTGVNRELVSTTLSNIEFYEGTLVVLENALIGDGTNFQEFEILDGNVGEYLVVYTLNTTTFERTYWTLYSEGTLYPDPATTRLYFLEETQNGYKVSFGNNQLGKVVDIGEQVGYDYIQPTATTGNGLTEFTWSGGGKDEKANQTYTQKTIDTVTLTLNSANTSSLGYTEKETIESIKFNAPKFFTAQGRAVTEGDYFALAINHAWISKARVIGGNKLTPIELGYVYITVKPDAATYPLINFTTTDLETLRQYFLQYSVVTISPIVRNPQYIYLKLTSILRYTSDQAPSTTTTSTTVQSFINTDNGEFGQYLEYSKLLSTIDNADTLTTSNISVLEKYALITSDNKVFDQYDLEVPGTYEIQLARYLLNTYTTRIEQYSIGTLIHTYYQDADYTITYNNADEGYVTIDLTATGESLDITDNVGSTVLVKSVYKNGTDQRLYVTGPKITGSFNTGTVQETVVDVTGGDVMYYGQIENPELVGGRYIVFTTGLETNKIYRLKNGTGDIGSTPETGGIYNYYVTIEAITEGNVPGNIKKYDLFDIYEKPEDLAGTGINLGNNAIIKLNGISADFENYYQLASSGAIYNDGQDDIYLVLNGGYREIPDYTLIDLDFSAAEIYTEPQYEYRLYFGTEDVDIFLNNQQLFNMQASDITMTTEKVSI